VEQALQHEPIKRTAKQTDIYLLPANNTDVTLKFRENRLNTKMLTRRQQGLECWHPHLDMALPLSAAFLREILFPLLRVYSPVLHAESYDVEPLMALLGAMTEVQLVRVQKERRHYCVDGCQIELSTVTVAAGFYTRTVALEAVEPMTVQSMRARLGLLDRENVNYGLGLNRLLQTNPALAEAPTHLAAIPVQPTANAFVLS
jgi:hypothetical protein